MKTIHLHIGLHRTATSSFQTAMVAQRAAFEAAGIAPWAGANGSGHAREIAFACLRPGVFDRAGECADPQALRRQLEALIDTTPEPDLLISSEHLSLIRTQAEIDRLRGLFAGRDVRVHILAVVRAPEVWFRSYADQIAKEKDTRPAPAGSRRNIAPDSWVRATEPMLALYAQNFPDMTVLDYHPEDMVGQLMAALGVAPGFNTRAYRRNQRSARERFGPLGYRLLRALFGSEYHGLTRHVLRAREAYLLRK
ncbi:hypothetical protein [Rhodobacter lacus]|uniref:Sulfotransferase family protein n=1 Tax=Rhodobacter lacus TaxID=1641972 RepID=A0ABW5A9W1_9RHOB